MLGILSRDYYSISLLQAAWLLAGQDNGYDLPRAIAAVNRRRPRRRGWTIAARFASACVPTWCRRECMALRR
jgi:hypothetical protein